MHVCAIYRFLLIPIGPTAEEKARLPVLLCYKPEPTDVLPMVVNQGKSMFTALGTLHFSDF
jgi:hypothetical protein